MNVLDMILITLKSAERVGADTDQPEGARYIMLTATLADELAKSLEKYIELDSKR